MKLQTLSAPDYMIPELDPNFLDGLGATEDELRDIGESLAVNLRISTREFAQVLSPFSEEERKTIIASYLSFEGDPGNLTRALEFIKTQESLDVGPKSKGAKIAWGVLGTASMAAGAYHGYKRNQSIGWAIWWGFWGGVMPVFVPIVAVAQGFGKPK